MKKMRKDLVAFSDTDEGRDYEVFESKWYSLPFGIETGRIDTRKLWWNLTSFSEQGNMYKNWMSAARTFYLNSPNKYKSNDGITIATQNAIQFDRTNQIVSESKLHSLIPEHLRNNGSGY